MTGKKSGMNSSKRVDGAGQSQPRWLAMGSLFTAGGVLVGLNALFILLVAFGNITDFETNQAFVHHVLSMDTANFGAPVGQGLDSAVMWHAVGSSPLQNAAYVGIIAWELLAGVALAAATIWWFAGSVRRRTRARALATIGLTIPAVAVAAWALDKTLVLGLDQRETVLLGMTLLLSMLTFGTGRTNILFGLVHMLVFAVFLFMVFVP